MERKNYEKGEVGLAPATSKDVRAAAAELRVKCPTPFPVNVTANLDPDGPNWGYCTLVNEGKASARFEIRLVRGMPVAMMRMVLVHEWAHVLDWRPGVPFRYDHRPTFGVHWGEVHYEFMESN